MKIYIILLVIFIPKCFSQSSSDQEIFQSVLKGQKDSLLVISKQSDGYKKLEEVVSLRNIYNKHAPEKRINLTNTEIQLIKDELHKNNNFIFSEDTFPNALLISKDTVQSFSSNKAKNWKKEWDAVIESKDTARILKFRKEKSYPANVTSVQFFSKPIYFRKDTLCILYHADLSGFHTGMGGCMSAYIFRKNNDIWEKYITITIGCY